MKDEMESAGSSLRPPGCLCDLCGAADSLPILEAPTLDGPLVRCTRCGLYYVRSRSGLAYGAEPSDATADRIRQANARFEPLGRAEERRLAELNAKWRLDLIRKHQAGGRLLDVGCGRGDFLRVARDAFDVFGVEPNPDNAAEAGREAPLYQGLVEDAPWSMFDVAASFHVIEHVASPTRFVEALAARLRPGGLLALETPDIGAWPYRLFGRRWRQFIPEHYYFFDRTTLPRLLDGCGFEVRELRTVGKYASPALVMNRLGRHVRLPGLASGLAPSITFRLNPGDILLALAVRK